MTASERHTINSAWPLFKKEAWAEEALMEEALRTSTLVISLTNFSAVKEDHKDLEVEDEEEDDEVQDQDKART
jgi:hypothetical protein